MSRMPLKRAAAAGGRQQFLFFCAAAVPHYPGGRTDEQRKLPARIAKNTQPKSNP
jgi:hypothetical protein